MRGSWALSVIKLGGEREDGIEVGRRGRADRFHSNVIE
jgi:hypothetical protein